MASETDKLVEASVKVEEPASKKPRTEEAEGTSIIPDSSNAEPSQMPHEESGNKGDTEINDTVITEADEEKIAPKAEKALPLVLGPKVFASGTEAFSFFYEFLHGWPLNRDVNNYEHLILIDLINKGHPEPASKVGPDGVMAFQIRNHPQYRSRCFFLVRKDGSVEDFSYRKCLEALVDMPPEYALKGQEDRGNRSFGGGGKWRGGGGGGRRGRGGRGRRN